MNWNSCTKDPPKNGYYQTCFLSQHLKFMVNAHYLNGEWIVPMSVTEKILLPGHGDIRPKYYPTHWMFLPEYPEFDQVEFEEYMTQLTEELSK